MNTYQRENHTLQSWEAMAHRADFQLAQAMNMGEGAEARLAAALYWLLQLCHAHELSRGTNQNPWDDAPMVVVTPALGVWTIGRVSCYGAEKYAEFDWNEGQAFSTLMSSARRHVDKMLAFGPFSVDSWHGDEPEDTEYSGLLHAGHAAWNIACLLDFIEQGRQRELDDVTPWRGVLTREKREIKEWADGEDMPLFQAVRRYRELRDEDEAMKAMLEGE